MDGSQGAKLKPVNGIIMQMMDDDDPGPSFPSMLTDKSYVEPTGPVAVDALHDTKVATAGQDAFATFTRMKLKGNFYNSMRGGQAPAGPFPGAPMVSISRNLCLTFTGGSITGVMTSSDATHAPHTTIAAADYKYLGEVRNTPAPAVNNGVIVTLKQGARWFITGTSYLTSLSIAPLCSISALPGHTVSMTVDGVPTPIAPGSYSGAIVVTVL